MGDIRVAGLIIDKALSMLMVILARGQGSGRVERQVCLGGLFPLCLCGIVALCFFLFGLWPRSAVVLLFSRLRRNANLAGGFAGRPCLSFFLVWFVSCHCHALLYSLDIVFVLI